MHLDVASFRYISDTLLTGEFGGRILESLSPSGMLLLGCAKSGMPLFYNFCVHLKPTHPDALAPC
jgi:hypothetical protein